MSQKWALSIPKDAARLGDLEKRAFGPKILKFTRNLMFDSHNIYVLGLLFFVPANATAE